MTQLLLILHFIGLVMAFAATFADLVVTRLIGSATAPEAEVLRRVMPRMLRLSSWGVVLLFVTGPMLIYSKYDGAWGALPWLFWLKMLAVAALTVAYGFLHMSMAKARRGDEAAAGRIRFYGQLSGVTAALVVVFAVLAFV